MLYVSVCVYEKGRWNYMSEEKIIESPDNAELFLGEAEEKTEEVPETAEEVKAEAPAAAAKAAPADLNAVKSLYIEDLTGGNF